MQANIFKAAQCKKLFGTKNNTTHAPYLKISALDKYSRCAIFKLTSKPFFVLLCFSRAYTRLLRKDIPLPLRKNFFYSPLPKEFLNGNFWKAFQNEHKYFWERLALLNGNLKKPFKAANNSPQRIPRKADIPTARAKRILSLKIYWRFLFFRKTCKTADIAVWTETFFRQK